MKRILIPLTILALGTIPVRAQVIFADSLDYPNGNITTTSSGKWIRHSGSGNDSFEVNHRYEVNEGRTDDVHRWFDPVNTNGYLSGVLYASFFMKQTNFPSATGTYFAHFMDTSNSFRGRVFTLTNTNFPGTYRIGVANAAGDNSPNKLLSTAMALNLDYQVVLKYDLDNALAEVWVNPASESDPSSGGTSDNGPVTNAMAAFSFRQASGEGVIEVANLVVGQSFASVTTNVATLAAFGLQPVPVTNYLGNPMSLSVLASGKGISYQWFSNNVAISGATSNVYSVASLSAADQGTYYCQVSNTAGNTNSASVFVSVNTTPTPAFFTLLPNNRTNAYGAVATFTAAAAGTGPLSYQWKLGTNSPITLSDGPSPIPGSTATISGSGTPALSISNLTKVDATNYLVTVAGSFGSPTNASASLTVLPPAILVSSGNTYTQNFDSLATSGTGNAWNDGGTIPGWYASQTLGGGVVSTYRGDPGTSTAGAIYSYGTNGVNPPSDRAFGSIASGTPGNFAYGFLLINDTSTLIATNLALAYTGEQWRNGGNTSVQTLSFSYRKSFSPITTSDAPSNSIWTPITALNFNTPTVGATATALDGNSPANRTVIPAVLFTNVTLLPGEEIFFRWFDLNDAGSDHGIAIDDLSLTFTTFAPPHTPPTFTAQPQNTTNNATDTAVISATVSGFLPMTFQWYKGSTPLTDGPTGTGSTITGATNSPSLTISNVLAADAGDYHVAVTNSLGGTNSANAHLTVIDPVVTTQPVNVTNVLGDNGNFFAFGDGTAPIGYQWLSNGVPIPGANNFRLDLPVTAASAAANYTVAVTNGNGSSTTSSIARIILVPTSSQKIATWDFNSSPPDANTNTGTLTPLVGSGTASIVGGVTPDFVPGSFADPATTAVSDDNSAWRSAGYPAAGTGNKSAGIQFSLSTASNKNIMVTWEQRNSATASKYTRLQYSTDGSTFVDHTVQTMNADPALPFQFFKSDLSGISGVNDNPNFAFRIVTEFQSTATGSGSADYVPTLPGSYGTAGTMRYDWLNIWGDPTNLVTSVPLGFQQFGNKLVLTWGSGFALQAGPDVTGTYTNVTGATSPYTNTMSGPRLFFRLKGN